MSSANESQEDSDSVDIISDTPLQQPFNQKQCLELRATYRNLIDQVQNSDNIESIETSDGVNVSAQNLLASNLEQVVKIADIEYKKIQLSREAAYDSELLALCALKGKEQAQKLQSSDFHFEPQVFADKLILFMQELLNRSKSSSSTTVFKLADNNEDLNERIERDASSDEDTFESQRNRAKKGLVRNKRSVLTQLDDKTKISCVLPPMWTALGRETVETFKECPQLTYIYGAFDAGDVQFAPKQQRQRRPADAKEDIVRPEVLKKNDGDGTNADADEGAGDIDDVAVQTSKQVDKMSSTLKYLFYKKQIDKLDYFEFVLNPTSFAKTIENCFHLSFLVKDGFVSIVMDDGLPNIKYQNVNVGTANANCSSVAEGGQGNNQCVVSLCMEEWEMLCNAFKIRKKYGEEGFYLRFLEKQRKRGEKKNK